LQTREFMDKLYEVLDRTKQLDIVTLTIEDHYGILLLLVELQTGEKYSIEVREINFII